MLGEPQEIQFPGWVPSSGLYSGRHSSFRGPGGSSSEETIFDGSENVSSLVQGTEEEMAVDIFSCDEFRMYEFKVRKCSHTEAHDWTLCPYTHPGEKARRRDPRKFYYSGTACPHYRSGNCKRGDSCEFAHGVFECRLHPTRYRTEMCRETMWCRRWVCFFAHTQEQLRIVPQMAEHLFSSGESRRPHHALSPPMNEVLLPSMQQLQLSEGAPLPVPHGSPYGSASFSHSGTPSSSLGRRSGMISHEQEESEERLESRRNRARATLYREGNFSAMETRDEQEEGAAIAAPDVDWVAELVN